MLNHRKLAGMRFGHLTAVRISRAPNPGRGVMYLCRCVCGSRVVRRSHNLVYAKGVCSCGCHREGVLTGACKKTHGMTGTRPYRIWKNMLRRCELTTHPSYHRYGGRGIRVCGRWHSFEKFYEDMGDPGTTLTLDRIDNDKGYSPDNCRWATQLAQCNNTRTNKIVEYEGCSYTIAQLSRKVGVPYKKLWARLEEYGWPLEEAICTK